MKGLTFTVIIPFFNAQSTLARAIYSVASQVYPASQLILINDGSTDSSLLIANQTLSDLSLSIPTKLISIRNAGPSVARNIGLVHSTSCWISFLDADDIWHKDKLSHVATAIAANPTVDIVAHNEYFQSPNGDSYLPCLSSMYDSSLPLCTQLFHKNFLSTSSITISSYKAKKHFFNPTLRSGQDYDYWLSIARASSLIYLDSPLSTYSTHLPNSISQSNQSQRFFRLMRILFRHRDYVTLNTYLLIVLKHTIAFIKNLICASNV